MKAERAIQLAYDSAYLCLVTDEELSDAYFDWLSFLGEYKDIKYPEQLKKLDVLEERRLDLL